MPGLKQPVRLTMNSSPALVPGSHASTNPGSNMPQRHQLADLADTTNLAVQVAKTLRAGDVIILTGELGAGKTTFTQALADALGITAPITSPTFVLARHHTHPDGGLNLVHVDAYRVSAADELALLHLLSSLPLEDVPIELRSGTTAEIPFCYLDLSVYGHRTKSADFFTDFFDVVVDVPS